MERLGTVYREANKQQQAIDTFRKMLALGDENAIRGYQQIIETYRDRQAVAAGHRRRAKKRPRSCPTTADCRWCAASQLADMGSADPAIAQVKATAEGQRRRSRGLHRPGADVQPASSDWPDAEAGINKAMDSPSKQEDKEYVCFVAGSIYERQKKYDKAEEAFRKVLADDPKNAMALNYLGYMLADRGTSLDEALGIHQESAVALDPQNGAYLDSLGWAYYKMGNYELAEENLRQGLAADRNDDPTVQDHLGDLYRRPDA